MTAKNVDQPSTSHGIVIVYGAALGAKNISRKADRDRMMLG